MEAEIESLLCKCSSGLWHKLLYLGIVLECDTPVLEAFYHWHSSFLSWSGAMKYTLASTISEHVRNYLFHLLPGWRQRIRFTKTIVFQKSPYRISIPELSPVTWPRLTNPQVTVFECYCDDLSNANTVRCVVVARPDHDNRLFVKKHYMFGTTETPVRRGEFVTTLNACVRDMAELKYN